MCSAKELGVSPARPWHTSFRALFLDLYSLVPSSWHPCVPWACSVRSQSAFSRWILPKRKPAGVFWPWFWTQIKAELVGVGGILNGMHLIQRKVTSTTAVLETSRHLPQLIFRCVRNRMDDINLGNCILLEWHVRCLHALLNFLLNLCNFCRQCFMLEVHWQRSAEVT